MTVQLNMDLRANYKCELLDELPQPEDVAHLYYPGATTEGGADGLLVRVEPQQRQPWIGTFAYGTLNTKGVSGVFAAPNPDQMVVIAQGRGYIVWASDPARYEEIKFVPIVDVRVVPAQNLIVFVNFTELLAYGPSGLHWRTKRLAWDSLRITEVTDREIRGEFWDIQSEKTASFTIDLASGNHQGGAAIT